MNEETDPAGRRSREDPRRILAMGGGGFAGGDRSPALDRLVLELVRKPVPKICFLPTASGDQREQLVRFHELFSLWPCEPSTLSLFQLGRDRVDPEAHLLSQDAIYVGGGSMRNLLAIWREHGIDDVMRRAWHAGIVLAGLSAGAMCWFEGGISMSGGVPQPVSGLGLLSGSLSVHRGSEPQRLSAYVRAVSREQLPSGYAADDGAALLYAGTRLLECVASRRGAGISRVGLDDGEPAESQMPIRLLDGATEALAPGLVSRARNEAERVAVRELRALRSERYR